MKKVMNFTKDGEFRIGLRKNFRTVRTVSLYIRILSTVWPTSSVFVSCPAQIVVSRWTYSPSK